MTEKEKMLAGKAYLPFGEGNGLEADRTAVKELLYDLNHTRPGEVERRMELAKRILAPGCEEPYLEPPFSCDYGYNIHVGKQFYTNFGCVILDCGPVYIGDYVLLAPHVQLYTVGHPLDPELRREGWEHAKPITIGDNVWIGGGSIVLGGVTIGDNVVIGAGSVVSKDIPANTLAVGNPCKVLRAITEEDRLHYKREYF